MRRYINVCLLIYLFFGHGTGTPTSQLSLGYLWSRVTGQNKKVNLQTLSCHSHFCQYLNSRKIIDLHPVGRHTRKRAGQLVIRNLENQS